MNLNVKPILLWLKRYQPHILLGTALLFSIINVRRTEEGIATPFENFLLQLIILASSIWGSVIIGNISSKEAAREIIKPHARTAFRRLLSLYDSLSQIAQDIQHYKIDPSDKSAEATFAKLEGILIVQIKQADDALEEWVDILPDEVQKLYNERRGSGDNQNG